MASAISAGAVEGCWTVHIVGYGNTAHAIIAPRIQRLGAAESFKVLVQAGKSVEVLVKACPAEPPPFSRQSERGSRS
jgi:hypothetical protein